MLTLWHKILPWEAVSVLNEVSADISMSLGADVVNYAWKMCQPTEEGVLLRNGGMKALGASNVQDNL